MEGESREFHSDKFYNLYPLQILLWPWTHGAWNDGECSTYII